VPILVTIDQEMRPWECSQTDRHTDANRFYNLSHAICYRYGTDNNTLAWARPGKSAHASQTFSMAHCTDSEDLPAAILKTANAASPNTADLLPAATAQLQLAADCQSAQHWN